MSWLVFITFSSGSLWVLLRRIVSRSERVVKHLEQNSFEGRISLNFNIVDHVNGRWYKPQTLLEIQMESVYQKRLRQSQATKERVRELRKRGWILKKIAAIVGVSKQRVSQILQEQ
jgi:DNA-directed RNA polymerase specialized sigma subunit